VLSLKSQVDLISYWESILLNDPYSFLTSWPKVMKLTQEFGSELEFLKSLWRPGTEEE
jgi:hypothetical protein